MVGAVIVELTTAYDTIWHHGLTCKLLCLLPDRHMVKMIMELVTNRSCTLTTGSETCSRLQCLKNSVPQGSVFAPLLYNIYTYNLLKSVLAPLLYNIYTYDLPKSISQKYAYPFLGVKLACGKVGPAKQPQQLKSQHPFVPAAKQFLRTIEEQNINVVQWADHAWSAKWCNCATSCVPSSLMLDLTLWDRLCQDQHG